MRTSNSAKASISIQNLNRQCVANHFDGVLITELASIPLSVFNPLTLLCCSFLLLYSASSSPRCVVGAGSSSLSPVAESMPDIAYLCERNLLAESL